MMNKNLKHIIYTIAFILLVSNAYSQSTVANAKLSSKDITIGDQVQLSIELIENKKHSLKWPEFHDTIINGVEVISKSLVDTTWLEEKKAWKLSQKILITSFDSGYYVIPPIKFIYGSVNDSTPLFSQTTPLLLMVNTIPIDTSQSIKDIKAPIEIPITFQEVYPWGLAGLGLAALIVGILYYIRKRRNAEPISFIQKKPNIPPHEIALKELDLLWNEKLWQKDKIKEYHSRLTDILRTYIDGRFQIYAMEMTTEEIMSCFVNITIEEELKRSLFTILSLADLVKFAKAKPLPTEHDISFSYVKDFITKTIKTEMIIDTETMPDKADNNTLS